MGKILNTIKNTATSAINSVKKAVTNQSKGSSRINRTNRASRSGSVDSTSRTKSSVDNKLNNKLTAKNKTLKLKIERINLKNKLKSERIAGKRRNLQKSFDNKLKTQTLKNQPKYRYITGAVTAGVLGLATSKNQLRNREMQALENITKDWADVNKSNKTDKGNK